MGEVRVLCNLRIYERTASNFACKIYPRYMYHHKCYNPHQSMVGRRSAQVLLRRVFTYGTWGKQFDYLALCPGIEYIELGLVLFPSSQPQSGKNPTPLGVLGIDVRLSYLERLLKIEFPTCRNATYL